MKTNTTLKNKYFFVILFLEEIYLGRIVCLHQRLILFSFYLDSVSAP